MDLTLLLMGCEVQDMETASRLERAAAEKALVVPVYVVGGEDG